MNFLTYVPTNQQKHVITHDGSAFVTACPGAGKTRTMVERARRVLGNQADKRGIAFLSFTNAAIGELEDRLRALGVLQNPTFPNFIGTFDSFLWHFFIAPFGIPNCTATPQLIPDKSDWDVKPFPSAQPLPLACFNRPSGTVIQELAKEEGFDVESRNIKPYETCAHQIMATTKSKGLIDFDDVRSCVAEWLSNTTVAKRLGAALLGRFSEIFVDEAQDCNPSDLAIIGWLRGSGIAVKVICDPNQSIYKFRGGVTDDLLTFANTFDAKSRLSMTGNFRSTPAICSAIVALRAPMARGNPDKALGRNREILEPVHILAYQGNGASPAIGMEFGKLAAGANISLHDAPILASTLPSASKAAGQPTPSKTTHPTLLLAQAAMNYHFAFAVGNRRDALIALHRIVLQIQAHINSGIEYRDYIADEALENGRWRPAMIEIANSLRFDPSETAESWLERARGLLEAGLAGTSTIKQRLKSNSALSANLRSVSTESHPARTIHSAKGREFPAVCVVLTSTKAGKILDHLEGKTDTGADEDARKFYVAASRAEKLLAIATPKSQATRLESLLNAIGCGTKLHQI